MVATQALAFLETSCDSERLARRPLLEVEQELIQRAVAGQDLFAEGLPPESLAIVAGCLARHHGRRVVYLGVDRASARARVQRYAGVVSSASVETAQGTAALPSGAGVLSILAEHATLARLQRALCGHPADLLMVESAQATVAASQHYRPALERAASAFRELPGLVRVLGIPRGLAPIHERIAEQWFPNAQKVPERITHQLGAASLAVVHDHPTLPFVEWLERLPRPALILGGTPAQVDRIYGKLQQAQIPVHRFHGAMPEADRAAELLRFTLPGRRAVLVAVSAFGPSDGFAGEQSPQLAEGFGQGYGRCDLRTIVHLCAPSSLSQYTEELALLAPDSSARWSRGPEGEEGHVEEPSPAQAGRYAVLTFSPEHLALQAALLSRTKPDPGQLLALVAVLLKQRRGSSLSLDTLAERLRCSRRGLGRLTQFLVDDGLIHIEKGFVQPLVDAPVLEARSRILAERLGELSAHDEARLQGLEDYALAEECRSQALARLLHERIPEACGACDRCADLLAEGGLLQSSDAGEELNRARSGGPSERAEPDADELQKKAPQIGARSSPRRRRPPVDETAAEAWSSRVHHR